MAAGQGADYLLASGLGSGQEFQSGQEFDRDRSFSRGRGFGLLSNPVGYGAEEYEPSEDRHCAWAPQPHARGITSPIPNAIV